MTTILSIEGFPRPSYPAIQPDPVPPLYIGDELPRTCLTLDRYAAIMGVNPVHFRMAYSDSVYPIQGSCDDVWFKYSWQRADRDSLYGLAVAIKAAEEDLQSFVGYPLCPSYICEEEVKYPTFHRPEYISFGGKNIRGYDKSLNARWMKLRDTGTRGTTLLDNNIVVTYADNDADTFYETAIVEFSVSLDQYALINDVRDMKIYFDGTNANPAWEIRYPKWINVTPTGTQYDVEMHFDSWLFIDPALQSVPTRVGISGGTFAINLENTTDNFVETVDAYHQFTNKAVPSAIFYWESIGGFCGSCGGSGCSVCSRSIMTGCSHIRDKKASIIVPTPATYNEETSTWSNRPYVGREPDAVSMHYLAGDASEDYECGRSYDPLSQFWADTITALATARLGRSFCGCQSSKAKADYYQTDMARSGEDFAFTIDFGLTKNPFGTRMGEILAFRRASSYTVRKLDAALL